MYGVSDRREVDAGAQTRQTKDRLDVVATQRHITSRTSHGCSSTDTSPQTRAATQTHHVNSSRADSERVFQSEHLQT